MRRVLEILSFLLFLAGLELAAGTLSHTISRIEETHRIAFAGETFVAPAPSFMVGMALILLGAMLGVLTLWARAQSKTVHAGPNCPRCGSETDRLKRSLQHKLLAALIGHRITRRRCGKCNWSGLSLKQ